MALSPLNLIFWNGKDVGSKNPRFSVVIDEMLDYCFTTDFSKIFNSVRNRICDLVILGEIYPTDPSAKHYGLVREEKDINSRYKGRIVSLGGNKISVGRLKIPEHFLVAYNTTTIARVDLNLLSPGSDQKGLLEISVFMKNAQRISREYPHKIVAVHLENDPAKNRSAINFALEQFETEASNKGRCPHLLIGDTNTSEESSRKKTLDNGNAIYVPPGVNEISFKNPQAGRARKSGQFTALPVDRAWVNTGLIRAEGAYLSGSQNLYKLNDEMLKDLKNEIKSKHLCTGVSDHPAMAVVLKAY